MRKTISLSDEKVINKIFIIRGKKVMLDKDLAEMYSVETRVLNQAVKRNLKRFPDDFMFQLTDREFKDLMSQIVISSSSDNQWGGIRKLPFAFTEQGVAMLSTVLNSNIAIDVSIQIIRVFTRMREALLNHKDILLKIEKLEKTTLNQDQQLGKQREEIRAIFEALKQLLDSSKLPRRKIGFKINAK
jgi:hypothetical protein